MRPLEAGDEGPLLDLWNLAAEFDPMSRPLLREKVWDDPNFDPELCWVTQDASGLSGFAMGIQRPGREVAYVKLLVTRPDLRRRGLASQMLERLEQQFLARGVKSLRVAESHPNYLQPGVDVRYTPGLLFFQARHYQRVVGETYNLHCDLSQDDFSTTAEERTLAQIQFARARPEDRESVMEFLAQHFPGWTFEVGRMFANRPVSLHLARQTKEILGFSGYDGNNLGTGWFGPMGTAPEARGLGLGRILLRRCLNDLQAQGHTSCVIPWVGPYGFYARHSRSRIERVFWRFERNFSQVGNLELT